MLLTGLEWWKQSKWGKSIFSWGIVVSQSFPEGVRLLYAPFTTRLFTWLLDHGANVEGPEPGISTPLVEAAQANAIDTSRILLERNAVGFLKSSKGTAVEAATGRLKKYIREWPASRSWSPPEGTSGTTVMRDPLGVHRQG